MMTMAGAKTMKELTCFKAYDIRGKLGEELNEDVAFRVGEAFAKRLNPKKVAVGRDIRTSSESLSKALINGLCISGVDVIDIGLCGTEEVYFATFSEKLDGGIMVTASHNPIDYNGMKLVRKDSRPISGDDGLLEIKELAERNDFTDSDKPGKLEKVNLKTNYISHLLSYISTQSLKPLKIVVNAGNGCAGPTIDLLEKHLPFEFIKINHEPDGTFPNGIPNPLLPNNRSATSNAIIERNADLGIAWDGDYDRCFLFDENGRFIEGYYIVGLLAEAFLKKNEKAKIIHDPRLTWNTIDIVTQNGGTPIMSKTGHAFIKTRMRSEDAVYGGEMSAHHYFKDFSYCDSGMIPWLLVTELISVKNKKLSELVDERIRLYPASGEINSTISDPKSVIEKIKKHYEKNALKLDYTDGLSIEFETWRFNLRRSNTEPVVRLNVESREDEALMKEKTSEILSLMK